MGNEAKEPSNRETPIFEVGEEVRKQADRCPRGQRCLQGKEEIRCPVSDCVGDKVFFIAGDPGKACKYCNTFGHSCYCSCPLRQELYRKFRV